LTAGLDSGIRNRVAASGDASNGNSVARLVKFILMLLVGIALGLGTTWLAVSGQPPFGAARSGAWTAWPGAGSTNPDPYARAIFARDGRIPLASASGLRFLARRDDAGASLDPRCTYDIAGPTPAAQFWTLSLLDGQGFPVAPASDRAGFTSTELLRASDGSFVITIAPRARPGNWLPVSGSEPFILMLSFYDTPLGTALQTGSTVPALPSVVKRSCP
jgi:hypothetical protein